MIESTGTWATILGGVGTSLLVLAFMLNVSGKIRASFLYTSLNLVGAGLAAVASLLIEFLPFVVLESVWFLAAAIKLISLYRQSDDSTSDSSSIEVA